ncbi:MAG: hypothetical protein AAGK05_19350 [Pseudomonadota bacterium]
MSEVADDWSLNQGRSIERGAVIDRADRHQTETGAVTSLTTTSFATMGESSQATRNKWLKEFNKTEEDPFKFLTSTTAFCKVCESSFTVKKKTQLQQHSIAQKHVTNARLKLKRTATQAQLEDTLLAKPNESKFTMLARELCKAMLSANIPWKKLQNKKL